MAAVAMLAMNSCEKENEMSTGEQKGTPVEFEMGINSITKTTTADNSYETTFAEGDEVGIFVYNGETLVTANAHYKLTDGKWVAQGEGIYAEEGVSYSYYAYYPYNADATDAASVSLSVATDQTAGYTGSDALMAKNESVAAGTTTVDLSYIHAFALVQVTLKGDQATKGSTVTLQNIYPTASLNLKTGEAGDASGALGTVAMKDCSAADATTYSYRAIVPAQTITTGNAILTISGDKNYKFTYSKEVSYESGKLRQYDVTLGDPSGTSITIGNQTITNWQDGTPIEGGEGSVSEELSPITSFAIPAITSETTAYIGNKYSTSNYLSMTEDGWFTRYDESYGAKVTFENGQVKLKMPESAQQVGWNNCSLGYHASGPFVGKYKLTCTFTAPSGSRGGFTFRSSDDKSAFGIAYTDSEQNSGLRGVHSFTATGTEQSVTCTIDFSKKLTGTPNVNLTTDLTSSENEDITAIYIYIYNQTASAEMTISNIKLDLVTE